MAIIVKYKIIKYDQSFNITEFNDLVAKVDENDIFTEMIEGLLRKNNIDFMYCRVDGLLDKTWIKYFGKEIPKKFCGENYTFKWANYGVGDMQKMFDFFDDTISIIVDPPGIGGTICCMEGVKFILNPGEKDRHEFEPHVHCEYENEKMRIRIDTLEVMKNDKEFSNRKKVKVAKRWIKQNQKKLLKCYNDFSIKGINKLNACFEI